MKNNISDKNPFPSPGLVSTRPMMKLGFFHKGVASTSTREERETKAGKSKNHNLKLAGQGK